jgi:2-dehydropantoate 2-reductase
MRYIIYGAGGVGSVIGGRLFHHGNDVVLISRGEHLTAIQQHGLILKTPIQNFELPIPAVGHPAEIEFKEGDVVFITVKSQHSEQVLQDLYASAGSQIPVVCAQNGVNNERIAIRRFNRVYGMLVRLPATYIQPGVVLNHAHPRGGVLDIGRFPKGADELAEVIAEELDSGGFTSLVDSNIMRWKYAKLLMNLRNALQAICGFDADYAEIAKTLREEALACYHEAGIEQASDDDVSERSRGKFQRGEIDGSPRTGSSSWQSIQRGSPTIETDFLNGEIVLLGALHGIPTPANRVIQRVANQMARTGMTSGSISIEEITTMILEETKGD